MPRIRLTDRFVATCSAPAIGRSEYSDAACPGLYFRVTARGAKSFSAIARRGQLTRKTLGRYPRLSLAAARAAANEWIAQVAASASGPSECAEPTSILFASLVETYDQLHLLPNLRSRRNIVATLSQDALGHLQARDIATIQKREVIAVLDGLSRAGKPHAADNLLKAMRAMFNWAITRGELETNPCNRIRPSKAGGQRDRILTDAEIRAVIAAAADVPAPFGAIVRMLLLTGARRNEVAQMRWSEIDGNTWTIPPSRSKSGRVNVLPLPPAAQTLLASLPRHGDDAYVFTTTNGARPSSCFSKNKRALDIASKTTDWRLHDLRRTCRSKLAQLGVPREVARRIIGHSVDALDAIYDRFDYLDEKGRALSLLADHYDQLLAS